MSEIIDQYRVTTEPYYHPVADEVELYEAAYSVRMPMMLKGPAIWTKSLKRARIPLW